MAKLSSVTMTMCKELGFDILALSETHKWRSDTDAIFSEQPDLKLHQEEWGIISCPPVKLRQTYPRDAFRRRTKSKYRERYKHV